MRVKDIPVKFIAAAAALTLVLAGLAATPGVIEADTFNGTLAASDPVFTRPANGSSQDFCSPSSTTPYDTFSLSVPGRVTLTVKNRGSASGGGTLNDPFVALYRAGFNSSNPCLNLVGADDDGGVAFDSELVVVVDQGIYIIVATSFSGELGTYTIETSNAPAPPPTPETGSGGLGGAGGAVGAAAAQSAERNRARVAEAAAKAAQPVTPPSTGTGISIVPPNTGDAGLAPTSRATDYALLAFVGIAAFTVAAGATRRLKRRP